MSFRISRASLTQSDATVPGSVPVGVGSITTLTATYDSVSHLSLSLGAGSRDSPAARLTAPSHDQYRGRSWCQWVRGKMTAEPDSESEWQLATQAQVVPARAREGSFRRNDSRNLAGNHDCLRATASTTVTNCRTEPQNPTSGYMAVLWSAATSRLQRDGESESRNGSA